MTPFAARAQVSDYTATRYPIVLVPGAFGFNKLLGAYNYWYGISDALQDGGANVYLADVNPLNATEVRGEELVRQIERVLALSGAARVNLIGHSHGGLTARYAAAVLPDAVASVTTVASPHAGAALADWFVAHPRQGTFVRQVVVWLARWLADTIGVLSDNPSANDPLAGLDSLTTAGAARFNARYPAGMPAVPCGEGAAVSGQQSFYAWGGVGLRTNPADESDPVMQLTSRVYGEDNDGLVSRCSGHFGSVIRDDYQQNHLDGVNQALGLVSLRAANPIALFRAHANRLKNAGL